MSRKILFVCLGNICRSALAEGVMLALNQRHQLNWQIDSAGTSNYHIGEAPDKRTIANADKHGIDLKPLRARQFNTSDFDAFDHILVMDQNNLTNVLALAQREEHIQKVKLFLDVALNGDVQEVPDPYYRTEKDFELVFQLVERACLSLMEKFKA